MSANDHENIDYIIVKGAREHNLKNLNLKVPKNKITVFTGLSGSGKSSLAFDTIYAEGQRRYVESLSAYARTFLDQLKKPDLDVITGLSPAIAFDQKTVGTNPRSTVGTITEIYDYLRLLYARIGEPLCPSHHIKVASQSPQEIIEDIQQKNKNKKFYILAPMANRKKGEFLTEFQKWSKKGFVRAKVDGQIIELDKAKKLAKTKFHDIDLIVDQLMIKESLQLRLSESVNLALSLASGRMTVEATDGIRTHYSIHHSCPLCGFCFPEMEPRLFSFNNPRGACSHCHGLGTLDLVEQEEYTDGEFGARKLEGVKYHRKHSNLKTTKVEGEVEELEDEDIEWSHCTFCQGSRLKPESLHVLIEDKNISELASMSAVDLKNWLNHLKVNHRNRQIADKILKQILERLEYLIKVGAGYLSMNRASSTLSGGEAQRIRLATQVGSSLIGVLYVMDEPSIGLHPRDHHRLLDIIRDLRDRGNTIILVEHDEDTIRAADYVIDLGPRAGRLGGEILAEGTPEEILKNPRSLTGKYLSRVEKIEVPPHRRLGSGKKVRLFGAQGNNLQNVDLDLPLGKFIAVTGVSGSGKSTLIIDTLYRILAQRLHKTLAVPKPFKKIEGLEFLDKIIDINQKPIGRTPRSTPATYIGLFPIIRDWFAQLPESKLRGYQPGQFSFNVKGGRCESCLGHGQVRVEMHFLSDVFVKCEICQGRRYNRETLSVQYKGQSIADVLEMTVDTGIDFFKNHPIILKKLETLKKVGLDYMALGQSSTTLSGGEAQRIKLSKELSRRGTGSTLYILDEPTTGLHFEDIKKLIELMQELVDQGNTVLVIEHNMEVVKCADHVIDLGPDGGPLGGKIIVTGTPEEVSSSRESLTGKYLKPLLNAKERINDQIF